MKVIPHVALAWIVFLATLGSGLAPVVARQVDARCGELPGGATPAAAGAAGSPTTGEWQSAPDMPRPRSELAAAAIDGWIYVAGGFGGVGQVDCFHPATGTWSTAPDLPVGVHHPGVAALDGVLYVVGGYTEEGGATDALWAYDPEMDAWEERAAMPTARGALGLAALGGELYAVGGAMDRLSGPVTGAVEAYDPTADRWESRAEMPTPREHLAIAAGDGRVFAVGGRANGDEGDALAGAAEAYDPVTDTWDTLPPLPTPRGGVSGVFAAGQMVVLGGERGSTTYDDAEAFDMATGIWNVLPPMPTERHGLASAALGNTIYAIAGSTQARAAQHAGANEVLRLPPSE